MAERTTPPTEVEYYEALEYLTKTAGINKTSTVNGYINRLPRSITQYSFEIADTINPIDRTTGAHHVERALARRSFLLGIGSGIAVIDIALPENSRTATEIFFHTSLSIVENGDEDRAHMRHQLAESIIEIGEEGLAELGERGRELFEDVEMDMVNDVRAQRLYRVGVGLTFASIKQYFKEKYRADLTVMEQEMTSIHDVDWDDLFS